MSRPFDITLAFPQWQGSGPNDNLPRGAQATADVCATFAPLRTVPLSSKTQNGLGVVRWEAIFDQFQRAQQILDQSQAQRVLTAGGDCSVDIATIDYLKRIHPGLNIIWVDAHLDGNTPETSPSGNFHGMPVAALFGRAPEPMQALLSDPMDPDRFRYFGSQVGDDGEWAFQRDFDLRSLDPGQPIEGPVHIHFDLDVFDPVEFPHLALTDGKLPIEAGVALVERIARTADLVGLTITEFAPADNQGAQAGSKVIEHLCQAASNT